MSRNTEIHFSDIPTQANIQRSKFNIPFDHKTTMNEGELVPFMCTEVLPGDTLKIDNTALIRMATPIYPVMDNAMCDIFYFYVPNRIVYEHWAELMGENTQSYWAPTVEYECPQVTAPEGGWLKGTIADYMGIPTGVDNISISAIPFRGYAKIYNDWFRNENLIEPLDIYMGDSTTEGSNGNDDVTDVQKGGKPVKVGRIPDYFSSCLPGIQKSSTDVLIPLGNTAPVIGVGGVPNTEERLVGKELYNYINPSNKNFVLADVEDGSKYLQMGNGIALAADLSNAGAATITQLRQAFAIQRMYEKDALYGSRLTELIRAHFGVISPDGRLQRSEFLGSKRIPINITQVIQNSSTNDTSPQGNASAYSLTIDNSYMFNRSFTEHGYVFGLACIRVDRTYQQGIEKHWLRKTRFDWYWPSLANLSNMPVKNIEIYAQGNAEDDEVFGYQEAWAEYRYLPNRCSGEMRSTYSTPLDSWHYGDKYNSLPVLGKEWFEEGKTNIDRTLAVTNQDQFIADFYVRTNWVRPLPVYSIPGLIDHH